MPVGNHKGGRAWTNINAAELNIANLVPAFNAANPTLLRIRTAPTATVPPSLAAEITIPRRPATPLAANVRFDGFTETVIINDAMEFRLLGSTQWAGAAQGQTSFDVILGTVNASAFVKVRATESSLRSADFAVTVPRRLAAPNAVYNAATDAITGVSAAMEFSLDGGATWTRATGTTIPRSALGTGSVDVQVRTAATAAQGTSLSRAAHVPGGRALLPPPQLEAAPPAGGDAGNGAGTEAPEPPAEESPEAGGTPDGSGYPKEPDEPEHGYDEKGHGNGCQAPGDGGAPPENGGYPDDRKDGKYQD